MRLVKVLTTRGGSGEERTPFKSACGHGRSVCQSGRCFSARWRRVQPPIADDMPIGVVVCTEPMRPLHRSSEYTMPQRRQVGVAIGASTNSDENIPV